MKGKLFTEHDAASYLGVSQDELIELVKSKQVSAYKIAGQILRFNQEELEDFTRRRDAAKAEKKQPHPIKDRLLDLIYYNDFYIVVIILIAVLAAFIFKVSF